MTISRAVSQSSRWLNWQSFKRPLASFVLMLGLLASGLPGFYLKASAIPLASGTGEIALAEAAQLPSDGVYLYGESPEPNQVGRTYAVFEVTDSEAVGAFYMPSSSFDCFYGEVEPSALDLVVVNSYDQVAHDYSMPLGYTDVAGSPGEALPALVGFHRIHELSHQDQQMLTICRNVTPQPSSAI